MMSQTKPKTWTLYDIARYCDISHNAATEFQTAYQHRRGTTPPPYYGHLYLEHFLDLFLKKADLSRLGKLMGINDSKETELEFKKLGLYNDKLCHNFAKSWYDIDVGLGSSSSVPGNIMIPLDERLCGYEIDEVYHYPDPFDSIPDGVWVKVQLPPSQPRRHHTYLTARKRICDQCIQQKTHKNYFKKLESREKYRDYIKSTCVVCKTEKAIMVSSEMGWELFRIGYRGSHPVCQNVDCYSHMKKSVENFTCVVCDVEI